MKRTTLRLQCLADAHAAASCGGLRKGLAGYRAEALGSESHDARTAQMMEREGLLQRWAGDCLHITDLGIATLEHWVEEADRAVTSTMSAQRSQRLIP